MQKMATDAETCKAKFVSVLHELHSDEGGGDGKTLIPKLNQAIHSFILYTSWLFSAVGLTKYTTLLLGQLWLEVIDNMRGTIKMN